MRPIRAYSTLLPFVFVLALGAVRSDEPPAIAYQEVVREARAKSLAEDWKGAAALYERAVKINSTNASDWDQLGLMWYQAKDYRKAIPAYEKALELRAGYPFNAAYNIACCFALDGQKGRALEWLQKSLDLGFRDLNHVRTDEDLVTLRDEPKFVELAGSKDTSKMSRTEGWRYDLWLFDRELKRIHYDPFRVYGRVEFERIVRNLNRRIPSLTDAQIMLELMKLAVMAGDGHTNIRPNQALWGSKRLPIQMFWFQEGLFITAADPRFGDLAGARVLDIAGKTPEDLMRLVDPLISRDNAMGPLAIGPGYLRIPILLEGLGLQKGADQVQIRVRDSKGVDRSVALPGDSADPTEAWVTARKDAGAPDPLYLKNRQTPYWYAFLADSKVLYFQYNSVRNAGNETFAAFCKRMFEFVETAEVEKFVVDIRWNGGGNSFLNQPLVHGLVRSAKINQPGKLFVITGRNTFSAAMNCATDIEMNTQAMFVGEPTGASPNFIGETVRITLPYSKMMGSISDLHWVRSWPMDFRTWIAPDLPASPSFELYRVNRDPAMEAILAFKRPQ